MTGSTRMGILCPEDSKKAGSPPSHPDERLPRGDLVAFPPGRTEPLSVAAMGFSVGGVTNLSVVRTKVDTLVVEVRPSGDEMCGPDGCDRSTAMWVVISIPPDAKTRGRVVEVEGDRDVPFTFCPEYP